MKYGVDAPMKRPGFDHSIRLQKRHETMKRNGSYRVSGAEDRFFQSLCAEFGPGGVKRQVRVNEWSIDFYVRDVDAYVQFDGVYWHGHDRSLDEIAEFNVPRDKVIYETVLRDRKQDQWFFENKMRLVRITDLDSVGEAIERIRGLET